MFYYDGGKFAVLGVLIDGFLSMPTNDNSITLKLLISKNVNIYLMIISKSSQETNHPSP